jgi:hypothetical protein
MPAQPSCRIPVVDHLGLVAGLFDALAMGDVRDPAPHQHPDMRDLTGGEAVNAMVLHGLGCIKQALSLVPRVFQQKPTDRRISPRGAPAQLTDDARGRTVDPLYDSGVTARYRLLAATAAERLGLAPRLTHLDSPSCPVDGRDHSDAEPSEPVVPSTTG